MHHAHPQVVGEGLEAGGAACTMNTPKWEGRG